MMTIQKIEVPDLGTSQAVDVIEILVKPGDNIAKDDTIVTLESDKATMEVPSPLSGIIRDVRISVGDKVTSGLPLMEIEVSGGADDAPVIAEKKPIEEKRAPAKPTASVEVDEAAEDKVTASKVTTEQAPKVTAEQMPSAQALAADTAHATPVVRRIAREFGVSLNEVMATGRKGRILKEDVQNFVKQRLASGTGSGLTVAPMPAIDFSQFGAIESVALNKIKRLTATHLHRSWVTVPHVTQFDEADITELEAFRAENKDDAQKKGYKLTPLVFIMKAVVSALKAYPNFNASLSPDGTQLILKKYFNIGVAVDTPNGLVVPVIRDVNQKGFFQLAEDIAVLSSKAREKGLSVQDMQGSCFTISSLGGIGGTAFTPIVNVPDVAILGVSKSQIKPVYQDGQFIPRLMLPLSLSYDHRVIDGAEAARFSQHVCLALSDIRRLLL